MHISSAGLEFIKKREDLKLKAYRDKGGVWTIGYGTTRTPTGRAIRKGDKIQEYEADAYLLLECDGIAGRLSNLVKPPLTQNQTDALISLCYNIGVQGFKTSTLYKEINAGREVVEDYFTRWNKVMVDGKLEPVDGLTNRRRMEYKLFMEP